jgi:MFS family permease
MIRLSNMSLPWIVPVLVCVALNMIDGFDVLVIALVSPLIASEWHLSGQQLGALFSAGVAGMVLGSMGLAPFADRYGRRRIALAGVVFVTVGMGLSAMSRSYWELSACRFLAGLGIGGILACAMVLVSEHAPEGRKTMASFLYVAGYSLGAAGGGLLAATAVQRWGWRVSFEGGALGSALLLPIAFVFLPESTAYRRVAFSMAAGKRVSSAAVGVAMLFYKQSRTTLLLWLAFFFSYAGYYFVFSWTPKLLTAGGLPAQQGVTAGVLLSVGGFAGTLLFALLGHRVPLRWPLILCLCSSALMMVAFTALSPRTPLAVVTGIALGATTTGGQASFYALTPRLYEPLARTSGMGWAMGIGRIGAIAAPFFAGILLDGGWKTTALFCLFGASFALAAGLALLLPAEGTEAGQVSPANAADAVH